MGVGGSRLSLAPSASFCPQVQVPDLGSGSIASFHDAGAGRAPHSAPVHTGWAPCPVCTAQPAGRRCHSPIPASEPMPRDPALACVPGSPTTTLSPSRWTVRPGAGAGRLQMPGGVQQQVCPFLLAGVFVYPLAEAEVVSGFEAEAAGRRVSFQLQSRRRSQAACCRALGLGLGTSMPRRCAQGKFQARARARARALECQPQLGFLHPRASREHHHTSLLSSSRH